MVSLIRWSKLHNYRPIVLLPVQGKIFEKIIKQLLEAEMIHRDVLHQNQYAFGKGRSTENAAGSKKYKKDTDM